MTSSPPTERTCAVCRTKVQRGALLRIGLDSHRTFGVIRQGSAWGRSTYVCPTEACQQGLFQKSRLERALRRTITPEERELLQRELTCQEQP